MIFEISLPLRSKNIVTSMENRKTIHYGFVIIACCCLIMGVNIGLSFSCAGIFYKPVSDSLGVGVGLFGLYMSVMYVAALPYPLQANFWSDIAHDGSSPAARR